MPRMDLERLQAPLAIINNNLPKSMTDGEYREFDRYATGLLREYGGAALGDTGIECAKHMKKKVDDAIAECPELADYFRTELTMTTMGNLETRRRFYAGGEM